MLCVGKIVIVDLSRGSEGVLQFASERIINLLLANAAERFRAGLAPHRIQLFLEEAQRLFDRAKFTEKMGEVSSGGKPREFFGRPVGDVVTKDGVKLVFGDGSWVCYRLSGTEPVVRVYSEARSEAGLQELSADAKRWIFE